MPQTLTAEHLKKQLETLAQDTDAPQWLQNALLLIAEKAEAIAPSQKEKAKSTQFIYFH